MAGSVIDENGAPAKDVSVQIFPATAEPRRRAYSVPSESTDADGVYRFDHLPPGRYVVGVNLENEPKPFPPTAYGRAGSDGPAIVDLGFNLRVELGPLRLPPPRVKRRIAGAVRWNDGRALGKVRVRITEDRAGQVSSFSEIAQVGEDGQFSAEAFEDGAYVVTAEAAGPRGWWDEGAPEPNPPIATAAVTIQLDGDQKGLRLVLKPERDPR